MGQAWLSLGSNIDPETRLRQAADGLRERFGAVRFSPVYRTAAVGFAGDDFLNAGALIASDLDVFELNDWLHALEDRCGRRRDQPRFSARTLDLDIVLYDDLQLQGPGNLQLPRPELIHAFVLKPLCDLGPDRVVPGDGRTLAQLWRQCSESSPLVDPLVL